MLKSVLTDIVKAYRAQRDVKNAATAPSRADAPRGDTRTALGPPQARSPASANAGGWTVYGRQQGLQRPFDVAVVTPTVLRATLLDAVSSVFAQSSQLRIQLLLGIDSVQGDPQALHELLLKCPDHVTACVFNPGYSTSVRHGGMHAARDGGALRTTLSYLANARYVAYLDDDNWWHPRHLESLLQAIQGADWAFALRWFVHPESRRPVCEDVWESLGPGRGAYASKFGGWVDPNCLMLDKLNCEGALRWWCMPLPGDASGMSADRNVYDFLQRQGKPGETGVASVYYALQPGDGMHPQRLKAMGDRYADAASALPITAAAVPPPGLSLVTTCKNRLHHLQETLPRMVALQGAEVVVVDYGCPQGTAAWVREHYPSVKIVEVKDDPGFCVARARNFGAREASAPWILFIDADVRIDPKFAGWFADKAQPGCFYLPSQMHLEAFGTVLCPRSAIESLKGYDEAFRGWGGEDWDLYFRLARMGLQERKYPFEYVSPISHGGAERYHFYADKDVRAHHLTSQAYFYLKWDAEALNGASLDFPERQRLMQMADGMNRAYLDGGVGTATVDLGERPNVTRFVEWIISRRAVYEVRARTKEEIAVETAKMSASPPRKAGS